MTDRPSQIAALAALALRRFPQAERHVTFHCHRCGARHSTEAGPATTGGELTAAARSSGHACDLDYVSVICDDDPTRGLSLHEGRLIEPDQDRRWSRDWARELHARISADIAADPTLPIGRLPTARPSALPQTRPLPDGLPTTVHGAFAQVARREPDAVAVREEDGTETTYRALFERAQQIAAALQAVERTGPIAIDVRPGSDEAALVLGVLASGRAYLPLDRRSPTSRLAAMVTAAKPALLVTDREPDLQIPSARIGDLTANGSLDWTSGDAQAPAYVMFTSGSTGSPKGVVIPHEAVIRLAFADLMPDEAKRGRFLRTASPAFDASTFELWLPLLHGGALVTRAGALVDPEEVAGFLREGKVDVALFTTGLFHQIAELRPEAFSSLQWLFTGGDVLRPEPVRAVQRACPRTQVVNAYGPTENTVVSATYPIPRDWTRSRVPVGAPVQGDVTLIVDDDGRPVPQGLAGELLVSGPGVALGYLNGASFSPLPGTGPHRAYRTGDQAAALADGAIDFLGRLDSQVKHRGFRIELAEVENAVCRLPGVRHAAACLDVTAAGSSLLCVVVADDATGISPGDLNRLLRGLVPDYMIPDRIVAVGALPLTTAGKVDRRRVAELARRTGGHPEAEHVETALPDPVRIAVERALEHGVFGDDDSLLDHGLHSLRALRLLRDLRSLTTGVISISDLFERPTVSHLRELVSSSRPETHRGH